MSLSYIGRPTRPDPSSSLDFLLLCGFNFCGTRSGRYEKKKPNICLVLPILIWLSSPPIRGCWGTGRRCSNCGAGRQNQALYCLGPRVHRFYKLRDALYLVLLFEDVIQTRHQDEGPKVNLFL